MKKKIILGVLSILAITSSVSAFAYSDCKNETVDELTELKILDGYDDGTFNPDGLISRAEISKIIATITGYTEGVVEIESFPDVDESHWAFEYVKYCKTSDGIDGYDDGTFRPNENVTYAEAVKICLSAVGYNHLIVLPDDVVWYEPWLDMAVEYKVIDNKDKDPNAKATRLEVAEMVVRTIDLTQCVTTGYDGSVPQFGLAEAFVGRDGKEYPRTTLRSRYFQEK